MYDVSGQTVSTQIEKLPKNTKGGPISLPAIVPGPGLYTYKVVSNAYYPLINNKTIVTSNSTNTISFRMNASTFYNVNYPNNRGNIGRIGAGY